MKFTLNWLKSHLDTTASLDQISSTLTMIGLEVEQITDPAKSLAPFTVAKIISAEKHPEADKLRVCKVQSDVGELQIVCGAPNARAGLFVALAKEGAVIPANGMVIKKTKIRNVESSGMLCSADELALGGDSEGIIELPEAKIGAPVAEVMGLNDPVIEIAITPNRADCLGVRGIARDLAAAGLGKLKPLPDISKIKGTFASPTTVSLASEKCPQFIGATIRGVRNGESPAWLKQRLESIGLRPISTLVDITNFITFDLGRPLHVFDAKKLKGNLTVRDAKKGEKLKALNGKDYDLAPGMTVIADESGVLSLGGITGGEASGCTEGTTDVFLEVALFDPTNVAETGRALQLDSDARYRFERGLDVDFVETGALLAIDMITKLCGGEVSNLVLTGKTPQWQRSIKLRANRVSTLGGVTIAPDKIESILKALGFGVSKSGDGWDVAPPSWRADVENEADLVEESLRIHGYDNIPSTPLPKLPGISRPALNVMQKRAFLAKRSLAGRGFMEACTWSFLAQNVATLFGGGDKKLTLINPIASDLDTMRPSLLPNLLQATQKNAFRGFMNLAMCEVGLQFHDITPEGQRMVAAGVRTGNLETIRQKDAVFQRLSRTPSTFDVREDAMAVLKALGVTKCDITKNVPAWYHPGHSGALTLGGKIILGYFGEIHPGYLPAFGWDKIGGRISGFEIFLDAIPQPRAKGKAKPSLKVSDFQASERDFAFVVDEKLTAAEILKAIAKADKNLITDIQLFDVYVGKGMEEGKKSVAVKVTLQAMDRTLSEQELTTVSQAIIEAAKGFGGQIRQ